MSFFDTKLKNFLFVISFLFLLLFSYFFLFSAKLDYKIYVKSGYGISNIGAELSNNNVITSNFVFKSYFYIWKLFNKCHNIHIGEYDIHNLERFANIYYNVCNGNSVMHFITIPEGMESREIVEMVNNNENLIGDKIDFVTEGVLLPETYYFKSGITKRSIIEKMNKDFLDFFNYEWENRERNEFIKTKKDALILASIIEKEAKTDEERSIIASVYLNRLKKHMRLEADPTTIYEITQGKYKMNRLLNRKDLKIKGEYNTYRKFGLPIAPICNAGKKSIFAVLHPAKTDYLYFVAKADLSGHIFSNNYKEHLKNIKNVKSNR